MSESVILVELGGDRSLLPALGREAAAADPDQALERLARTGHSVEALVLLPGLEEPLELAQRAHALDRDLAIIVLCEPERLANVARAVEFAPFLGDDVVAIARDGGDAVRREVAAATERTRRRRRVRATDERAPQPPPAEQYLGRLLDRAPIGVAIVDPDAALIGWNRHAGDIFGASERDTLGVRLSSFFPGEEGRRLAELVARSAAAADPPTPETFRRSRGTAEPQFVEVGATSLTGRGGEPGVMLALRDVTDGVLAKERLRFLASATEALAESIDYEATLAAVARLVVPTLADWCIVDELREDGTIARVAVAAASREKQAILEQVRDRYPPTWDSPQPAVRALRAGEAVVFTEFTPETLRATVRDEGHFALIDELGPHSTLALPLVAHGETLGAITFTFSESRRRYGAADVALAEEVARRAALAIDRARAYRRAQRARLDAEDAHERVAFLAQATQVVAESLDYEVTLERVASLTVPRLADWCVVYVLEGDGAIRRLAVQHVDEAVRDEIVAELAAVHIDPRAREGVPEVLRSGKAALHTDATPELLAADVVEPARFTPILARLGISSWICVPLRSRGRTLGAISFIAAESGRRYGDDDLALAEELARRAAVAVDNARLYHDAQDALASRERTHALLGTLLESAPVGLAFFDENLRFVLVNDALARMNGLAPDDHLGKTVLELLPGVDPSVADDLRRVLETGEPVVDVEVEGRTPAAPETVHHWLVSYYPVRVDGRAVGIGAVVLDITDRKRVEAERSRLLALEHEAREAAERAQERVAFLAEASTVLASSLEYEVTLERAAELVVPRLADWCVVDIAAEEGSPRRLAVAHVDPAKVKLARELERRYPPDPNVPRGAANVIRTGEPELVPEIPDELLVEATRDAEHLALVRRLGLRSFMCVPMAAHGRTLGAITFVAAESGRAYGPEDLALAQELAGRAALAVDNSRLFREAAARAHAARALATVGDGVVLLDSAGVIRLWNPGAEVITGLATADVVGRPAEEVVPGWGDVARLVPLAESPGPTGGRPVTLPLDIAGRELWLSVAGVAFSDGSVFTFRDVTEERRLEALKTDFVATASHELRTPLAAVYGAAMTLRRSDFELDDERRELLLSVVAEESDRLARIVNDILWASRLDSGELEIDIAPLDARAPARRVVEAARTHLPHSLELVLVAPDDVPLVAADEQKLTQVLTNLVENAVKYSPDGGRIEVALEPGEGTLVFAVRDEGLGIPANEVDRIFEKFYRLDPNLTRGVGGTGLGLYICRELVRRMNGRIRVTAREGRGSSFCVELPLAERAAPDGR